MDKEIIYILLFSAALFAVAVGAGYRGRKKLIESGEVKERRHNFMEYAETFTLRAITPQQYISALREFGLMEFAKGNVAELKLHGDGFEAEILWLEAPEDVSKFCFQFLSWRTNERIPMTVLNQNKLLTKIEKMFLKLDPQTQVTYQKMNVR